MAPAKTTHYGVAAIALGLSVYIWWATGDPATPPERPKPEMFEGAGIDGPITLVTADKHDLSCSMPQEVAGYRCAFKEPDEPWPGVDTKDPEARKKLLAPYMTVDDVMFLIPGMFEEPAVDERYRDEIPKRLARDKLERFTAQCKLKLVKHVDAVQVQWQPKTAWQGPHKVWIAEATSCQVSEP
ncbi:MAG: hypothetical protein MUF54_11525 [Polyangiaceae bacterium]|nr:hypothetical protein [Polyangiaceae bacterium]